jgi:hypothetical protein
MLLMVSCCGAPLRSCVRRAAQACLSKNANETDLTCRVHVQHSVHVGDARHGVHGLWCGFYRLSPTAASPTDEDEFVDTAVSRCRPTFAARLGKSAQRRRQRDFPDLAAVPDHGAGRQPDAPGLIEGFADTVASFLKLWSVVLTARRRKWLVVVGYPLAAVARPLMGLAAAPWHVFAARAGDRVGKGLRTSPRDALIADSTNAAQRGRAFGFHRSMDHLGAAIGPVLATLFLAWRPDQLQELIFVTAVPGALVVLLLVVGLREKPAAKVVGILPRWTLSLRPFDRNFRVSGGVVSHAGKFERCVLLVRAGELGISTPFLPLCGVRFIFSRAAETFWADALSTSGAHALRCWLAG